jgi:predicted DNA-binding protein (MmcQ/YjbR family)
MPAARKPPRLQTLAQVVKYCLAKPGAWLDDPWGGGHQVAKVGEGKAGKMFMMAGAVQDEPAIALRFIDKEDRDSWRQQHPGVILEQPYMVHQPWNRVCLGKLDDATLQELIDISYDVIVSNMPKKHQPAGWQPLTLKA